MFELFFNFYQITVFFFDLGQGEPSRRIIVMIPKAYIAHFSGPFQVTLIQINIRQDREQDRIKMISS